MPTHYCIASPCAACMVAALPVTLRLRFIGVTGGAAHADRLLRAFDDDLPPFTD